MTISLYVLCDFVLIATLMLILYYDNSFNVNSDELEAEFCKMTKWYIFFCLQDLLWGICNEYGFGGTDLFFASSTLFHLATIITTYAWIKFVLKYLGDSIHYTLRYLNCVRAFIVFQVIMLAINVKVPVIFDVSSGVYQYGFLWWTVFVTHFSVYCLVFVHAAFSFFKTTNGESKSKYKAVVVLSLPVIVLCVFQIFYPEGPYCSIAYFFTCFISHIFVVSKTRYRLQEYEHEQAMADAKERALLDELTGLINRKGYEEDIRENPDFPLGEDFVYASIDLNGLKDINDTYGHAIGDETLIAAAECLKKCVGPYGRIYRTGGDEFVAIFFASEKVLEDIKRDIDETCLKFKGSKEQAMSLATGFVMRREMPLSSILDMARVADKRMYASKSNYYMRKGVDRRSQQSAFTALATTYAKMLKINLTDDTYQILKVDKAELENEPTGVDANISWDKHRKGLDVVHPDDRDEFLEKTDLKYLRDFFAKGNESMYFIYKRKIKGDFHEVIFEVIKADDYSDERQTVFAFVKNIEF